MKASFFISDIHLGSDTGVQSRKRLKILLDFLEMVKKEGSRLFIVGDLFDFWFEYKTVIPRGHFELLFALKSLLNAGVELRMLRGNHDFWINSFFEKELSIPVYDDFLDITLEQKKFCIGHGDGLAADDRGYRFLKKILRNPFNIRLFRLLHPDTAHALATFSSRMSRNHGPKLDDREDYIAFARKMFRTGYDCVVLGHTHAPVRITQGARTYVNTGDWLTRFTYAKFAAGVLSLEHWSV